MFSLKFISGKYLGGEFPLRPDTEVVIGRANRLDVVLGEDMVSRKHARIIVTNGSVVIEDLGSTNGTFVNGEKIRQTELREGDRILIGTSILKLVQQGDGGPTLAEAAALQEKRGSSMTGKLEEIPLLDLLQLLHTSKKSGVLILRGKRTGRLFLREGHIYYALIDEDHELGPVKSFNRIVGWERGEFELGSEEPREFMVELEMPVEALLIDAMRQLDEYRRIQDELPAEDARLSIRKPLGPRLRDLSPEQLDVLQLVHNHATLRGVLDRTEKDDATAATALLGLMKKDYVQAG